MVSTSLTREVGRQEFDYGKHTIHIIVEIVSGFRHDSLNAMDTEGIHRVVRVLAKKRGSSEVTNENSVYIQAERTVPTLDKLLTFFSEQSAEEFTRSRKGPVVPSIETQVEKAVKPVFEELDTIYEFTTVEYEFDIESSVHRIQNEMSWVEIEDDIDRLCAEVDALTT